MSKTPSWSNIKSFIEGNLAYYKDKLLSSPPYLQEQYHYRLSVCNTSCIPHNACEVCQCPPLKKAWVTASCNNGEKFPDLMDYPDWEDFKTRNNINIQQILTDHDIQ